MSWGPECRQIGICTYLVIGNFTHGLFPQFSLIFYTHFPMDKIISLIEGLSIDPIGEKVKFDKEWLLARDHY